jgi:hypothetical protein
LSISDMNVTCVFVGRGNKSPVPSQAGLCVA